MKYTKYAHLEDEELLSTLEKMAEPTPMETELAMRLANALDDLNTADEIISALCVACHNHGVSVEVNEARVQ